MDDKNNKAAERAKRLEEIRAPRTYKGGKCSRCNDWTPEECSCDATDVEWLLAELAAAEQVISYARHAIEDFGEPEERYALRAYDRGER